MICNAFKKITTKMRPLTITVEGNIGCGKTTFLNYFENNNNNQIAIVTEPVSEWKDLNGFNLLELMYLTPKKFGFCFQSYVQLTMLKNHVLTTELPVKMMERSLHSGRFCFIENLYKAGLMSGEEKAVLDEWYRWTNAQKMADVDLIVYLRAKPETVLKRVLTRGREEESGITLDVLENIHNLHESWLMRQAFPVPAPVLVVDAEKCLSDMFSEYVLCENKIKEMRI